MARKAINTYHVPGVQSGFTQLIVGNPDHTPLFVSGITARKADGTIVGLDDYRAQTRQVCDNLQEVLGAAGATLDNVMQIRTYVRDLNEWEAIESVWTDVWGDTWPASTIVEINRLFDERQLIEMDAVALVAPSDDG